MQKPTASPDGEATRWLTIFADFCNSKNRVKESRAKKRAPLIRRRTATPFPPRGRLGKRKNFNGPLSPRGCSPLSPKGKARGLKDKERHLQYAEADSFPVGGSQECGLMIRLLFCGNDGQRFLRSASCRTRKSTYAAARALPFSESLRKLSISSDSAPGKVASTRRCRCGSSVSLNILSTETLKKRERRNKADAVASLRPFSDFAIADRLSPVALANCC